MSPPRSAWRSPSRRPGEPARCGAALASPSPASPRPGLLSIPSGVATRSFDEDPTHGIGDPVLEGQYVWCLLRCPADKLERHSSLTATGPNRQRGPGGRRNTAPRSPLAAPDRLSASSSALPSSSGLRGAAWWAAGPHAQRFRREKSRRRRRAQQGAVQARRVSARENPSALPSATAASIGRLPTEVSLAEQSTGAGGGRDRLRGIHPRETASKRDQCASPVSTRAVHPAEAPYPDREY